MHAIVMNRINAPLIWPHLPDRQPGPGEIRVKVSACGVCRTDLHVLDGELPASLSRSFQDTKSSGASMHSGPVLSR